MWRTREELTARLQSLLEPRPEVLEAYLFGSWARGQAQPHSDVDVAVYLDESKLPQLPYSYEAELGAACISALGSNRVDIVVLNDASPMLYYRVLRDGVRLLTRNPIATVTREGRAYSRYCDYIPQLRKIDAAFGERVRQGRFGR